MKRVLKPISAAISLLLALAAFSGCIKYVAIDEYGYVMTIGIDKGETLAYRYCFIIQVEGDTQEASDAKNIVVSAEGNTIHEAINIVEVSVPFQLHFGRTNYLLFSKDVAQTGYITRFIGESFKNLGVRRSTKLMVILDNCLDYCSGIVSKNNPNTSKRQYSILREYSSEGLTPMTNIALFTQNVNAKRGDNIVTLGAIDYSIPSEEIPGSTSDKSIDPNSTTAGIKRTGGLRSYYMGCAVFDGGIMKGVLNGGDTETILMAKGLFHNGRLTYGEGEDQIVLLLKNGGMPKVDISLEPAPKGELSLVLQCHVESGELDVGYEKWNDELKPRLEEYMCNELKRVFELCRSMNSDACEIGKYAAMHFSSVDDWENYNWKERYSELEMQFNVSLYIENEEINSLGG